MISRDPRRRRQVAPSVNFLESRRLLSFVVTSDGQDGYDYTGPDASQGGDGIVDLHLVLQNLSYTDVNYVTVQGPTGFKWESEPFGGTRSPGYAFADWVQNQSIRHQGDLFINPEVKSDLSLSGGPLPLGGSTGALIGLTNISSVSLTVSVYYQGETTIDSYTISNQSQLPNITNKFVSATDPMPAKQTPSPVLGTFSVASVEGQDGQGPHVNGWQGLVHITVAAPSGVTFNSNEFNDGETQNGLVFQISDNAGQAWISNIPALNNYIFASMSRAPSSNSSSRPTEMRPPSTDLPRIRCCCKSRFRDQRARRCTQRRSWVRTGI